MKLRKNPQDRYSSSKSLSVDLIKPMASARDQAISKSMFHDQSALNPIIASPHKPVNGHMKELSFYRVPPILTDFSENESERHQPLEDSKEAAEVGELLDAAPNDQSSVWSDHRFHNPDDPAKLTGSGIVQRASQGPGKLEIWLHVVLILCILLTSIILAILTEQSRGAFSLHQHEFLVFLATQTFAAIILLSFGHHGIVLILWIALFILAPLVVALIFHFEPQTSLYRSSRLWFCVTLMDVLWTLMWLLRTIQKRHFSIEVASASIFIFYCDFFFFYVVSRELLITRSLIEYIIEPVGGFLLGFYAWTIMHFLAFGKLFTFRMKLFHTKFSGFKRTLPRGPCTLYIICAALFGAVFTSFCLLKNEVMNLPSSQNRHLDPGTMGIHFALEIIALRVIINHSFLRRGLQSLCYTVILASGSILIFNYFCLDFDQEHRPYNISYIQMYSLGASWSVYILIVSLYHFSPPLMQLLTITSFILLNLFEGLVYPQAALLPSFVYSYIAPITRSLLVLLHLFAFIYFLLRATSRLLSIVQAAALLLYVWGFSILTGEWLTDQKLKPDYSFQRLLPLAFFEYVLLLLPCAYLILWSELLYTRYRFTQLYGISGLQAYKIPLREKLHAHFSTPQCEFKLCGTFFLVFGCFLPIAAIAAYLVFQLRTPSSLPQQLITHNRFFFLYGGVVSFFLSFFASYMVKHILRSLKVSRNCTQAFLLLNVLLVAIPLGALLPLFTFVADYEANDFISHLPSCILVSLALLTLYFYLGYVDPIQQYHAREVLSQREEDYVDKLLEQDNETYLDSNFIRFILQLYRRGKNRKKGRQPEASYFWRIRIIPKDAEGDGIQLLIGSKKRHQPAQEENQARDDVQPRERQRVMPTQHGRMHHRNEPLETEDEKELRITEQFEKEINSDRQYQASKAGHLRFKSVEEPEGQQIGAKQGQLERHTHYRLEDSLSPPPIRSNSMMRSQIQLSELLVKSEAGSNLVNHSHPSPLSQLMRSIGNGQNVKVTRLELDINGSKHILNEHQTRGIIQDLIQAKRLNTHSNILDTPISFRQKEQSTPPGVLHNLVLQEYATRVQSQRRVIHALYRNEHFPLKLKDVKKYRKNCQVDRLDKHFAFLSFTKYIKERLCLQDITSLASQFVDIFEKPEQIQAESIEQVVQDFLTQWRVQTKDKVQSEVATLLLFEELFFLTLMESQVVTLPLQKLAVALASAYDEVFTEIFSLVFDIHAVLTQDSKFCLTREKFQHLWEKLRLYEIIKGEETEEEDAKEYIEKAELMTRLNENLQNQKRHEKVKQSVQDLTERIFRIYPCFSRYFLLRILNRMQLHLLLRKEVKDPSSWSVEFKRDCRDCFLSLLHFPDSLFCFSKRNTPYQEYNPSLLELLSQAFVSKNIHIYEEQLTEHSHLVQNCLESLNENPLSSNRTDPLTTPLCCLQKSAACDILLRVLGSFTLALLSLESALPFSLSSSLSKSLSSVYLGPSSYLSVSDLYGTFILLSLILIAILLQICAMNRHRQYNQACRRKCDRFKHCAGLVSYLYFFHLSTLLLPVLCNLTVIPFQNAVFLFSFLNLTSLLIFSLLYSISFLSLFKQINSTRANPLSHRLLLLSFWLRLVDGVATMEKISAPLTLALQSALFVLYIALAGGAFVVTRREARINVWEGLLAVNQGLVKLALMLKALQVEMDEVWIDDQWLLLGVGVGYMASVVVGPAVLARKR